MSAYVDKWTSAAALGSSGHTNAVPASVAHQPVPAAWSYSSVSTFGQRYTPPRADLSTQHSVEALVEGSDMSNLQEGSPVTPERTWVQREGRNTRYENKRVGGTIVVHFIKKNMWYLETALAMLEGEELSEVEMYEPQGGAGEVVASPVHGMSEEEAFWKDWAHDNFGRQKKMKIPGLTGL